MTTKSSRLTKESSQATEQTTAVHRQLTNSGGQEVAKLRAQIKALSQELEKVKQERDEYNQYVNELCKDRLDGWVNSAFDQVAQSLGFETATGLQKEVEKLRQGLRQKTEECDKLRNDVASLLVELTEERQQRIEANAYLLATARALGLDAGDLGELPRKAAEIMAEGSAVCQEWGEELDEAAAREAALIQAILNIKEEELTEGEFVSVRQDAFTQLLEFAVNPSQAADDLLAEVDRLRENLTEAEGHAHFWHRMHDEALSHAQEWQKRVLRETNHEEENQN
jgi:predicted RNase H-like nuclease (RuvC/YqgF family)